MARTRIVLVGTRCFSPSEGHQPPTTVQLFLFFTSRVTSLPWPTAAIGVPFQVPTPPVTATLFVPVLRLATYFATSALAGTVPPR